LTMETIHILLDGTYFATASTDPEGHVRFSLLINQSFSIGEHTLTFEYLGNERYQQSLVDIVVNVGSSLYLNITPLNYAEIGQNLTLRIDALDAYSRPLSDGIIEIIDLSTNQIVVSPLSSQSTTFVQFPIFGGKGPRLLHINVTNGILLNNNTIILNLNIWTRPTIEILSSNILGYASPQQTLLIGIRLEDYQGALSDKLLQLFLSGTNETTSVNTRIDGLARIEFQGPSAEGYYLLYILYEGNQSDYELSCFREFSFIVSQTIPIEVILSDYEIISPFASIRVRLKIQALNGSYLEGIPLHYNWITMEGNSISTTDGITELHLPMPPVSGIHTLHYEIGAIGGLQATSGIIYIITTSTDANSSQGVGFYGLFIGFVSSLGISLIPVFRRRLLVG
ncbi:MAG: carboxypeptidase regulatory-like domain-containing protein, partial [Candidatus Thorarchaeota archaeon]|nr:carboxypeptidase regulatory-like domain-containing protein [Candidatus Thorarchaeota archaeon]